MKFSPKWNPEYVEKLREHLSEGRSFMSFSGKIHVNPETIYCWAKTYPEFREVKLQYAKPRAKLYA